jgi:hypothetical protein
MAVKTRCPRTYKELGREDDRGVGDWDKVRNQIRKEERTK